jgi:hypothetical protein
MAELAGALNNSSDLLAAEDSSPHDAALASAREAVGIYRSLASNLPAAFEPDLALALTTLCRRLQEAGQQEEALAAIGEAAMLHRKLAASEPTIYDTRLASSLIQHSTLLANAEQPQALAVAREAVDQLKRVLISQPDFFRRSATHALITLARLRCVGVSEEVDELETGIFQLFER